MKILASNVIAFTLLIAGLPGLTQAQALKPLSDFPAQPITIISPFPPGGGNDSLSRVLAAELQTIVGQPVVVENKAGAGGNLAAEAVAKALA